MKKTHLILFLCLVVPFATFGQLIDKPAATVKLTRPEFISVNQLQQQIAQIEELRRAGLTALPTAPSVVLDSMIQEVLLKQGVEGSKVVVTDAQVNERIKELRTMAENQQGGPFTDQQFRELIRAQTGMSYDEYRANTKQQLQIQQYIQTEKAQVFSAVDPLTETVIREQYRRNATNFTNPEMVKLREVFIDTRNLSAAERRRARERAEEFRRKLENGEATFSELVLQHSDDNKARYNEGDMGWFVRNDPRTQMYGERYIDAIFEMEIGVPSRVIESSVGYHLVLITDHRDPKLLTLDDPIWPWEQTTVREYIRLRLAEQQNSVAFQRAMEELTGELRAKAEIRIFEENIESLR